MLLYQTPLRLPRSPASAGRPTPRSCREPLGIPEDFNLVLLSRFLCSLIFFPKDLMGLLQNPNPQHREPIATSVTCGLRSDTLDPANPGCPTGCRPQQAPGTTKELQWFSFATVSAPFPQRNLTKRRPVAAPWRRVKGEGRRPSCGSFPPQDGVRGAIN